MKRITSIILLVLAFASCRKITDVIDRQPPNNLVPENVAKTAEGARNLLNGAYAMLHDQYYYMHVTEMMPGVLGGTMARNGFLVNLQFQDNDVKPELSDVNNSWTALYKMINQANWVIQLVGDLPQGEMPDAEKASIVAQAKALRAMAHFDALKLFGQYWDSNSKYGVIIRTEPANFTTRSIARSTVAEVYQQVIADLDDAIANGPEFTKPIYMSKLAAKALKARVLLYKGEYANAAALADEVINSGKRTLSATYTKVFSDGFNSSEMIFIRATDEVSYTMDRKKYNYGSRHAIASPWLKSVMAGDPRIPSTYSTTNSEILKVNNVNFYAPDYYIRLAEMYLIKAEGLARSGAPLDEAKAPLLVVRSRAYGTPQTSAATTREELLDEIFLEIIRELAFENGSDWFAEVRFDKIMSIKPKVTSVNQYILPIPEAELLGNPTFGEQNPGY
ncbi:MAG: RagB/SusD family nutrient uptake outer membrane protein [Flavisolibacter sp.]